MTKSKKHSPIQTETEQSIISQVPKESMKEFIEGLVAMAQSKRKKQEAVSLEQESEQEALAMEVDSHPGPSILSQQLRSDTSGKK